MDVDLVRHHRDESGLNPMKNIMIDGYNLGMEKGTGVATYARNLSYELHNLGFGVSTLYGKKFPATSF
jgi:hypothetical protein